METGGRNVKMSGLTALEALGVAIRREADAAQVFERIAAACANPLVRDRFLLLARESAQVEALLRNRHHEVFPDVELSLPPASPNLPDPMQASDRCTGLKDAVRWAVDVEREAREEFEDAVPWADDWAAKEMFVYLADVHARRASDLEAEYDLIVRYPHAFDDEQAPWRPEARLHRR